jgi:subtilisin family serine protease
MERPARIIVKLRELGTAPYADGLEIQSLAPEGSPARAALGAFAELKLQPLFMALPQEQIESLAAGADLRDASGRGTDLLKYYVVECPPGTEPGALVEELRQWSKVERAYVEPRGTDPAVNPGDDPRFPNQRYLGPAPLGIDAVYAWKFPGGDGLGQRVIDLERGWTLDHEDLSAHRARLLYGKLEDESRWHGTAVLGVLCAVDNGVGGVGIVPNLESVNVVSYADTNIANGVLKACAHLSGGDVLIVEVQLGEYDGWENMPAETAPAEFDAIRLAVGRGITVIAAAGNGGNDLDSYKDENGDPILRRTWRDSGAIMVGAASAASPHRRLNFSNFGSRLDCFGWGEAIDTCHSDQTGATQLYSADFNGTSGATPIVAGAALCVQGLAQKHLGRRYSPHELRAILSDPATNTASKHPARDRIGTMPNLRAIIHNHFGAALDAIQNSLGKEVSARCLVPECDGAD